MFGRWAGSCESASAALIMSAASVVLLWLWCRSRDVPLFQRDGTLPGGYTLTNTWDDLGNLTNLEDTNGDDKADTREVIMEGWGIGDTHAQGVRQNPLHGNRLDERDQFEIAFDPRRDRIREQQPLRHVDVRAHPLGVHLQALGQQPP